MVEAETLTKYVTPELVYLVRVERSKATLGGRDAVTPISLRATMIMAPEDGEWKIVHRHAEPITLLGQPNQSFSNSPSREVVRAPRGSTDSDTGGSCVRVRARRCALGPTLVLVCARARARHVHIDV
jgi:hypothetical protein